MKKIYLFIISLFLLVLNINAESISRINNQTTVDNINDSLDIINNTLVKKQYYLTSTNRFNCSSIICTDSNYNDIGVISVFEYNRYGSYLTIPSTFYANDNNLTKVISFESIKDATSESVSGLRPNVYVKKGTRVTGSGKRIDPWRFVGEGDNTKPIIINVEFTPGLNDIKAVVNAKDEETSIKEYCFSINKGEYKCQESETYLFINLEEDTEYLIDIYVVDEGFNRADYPTTKVKTLITTYELTINVTNGTASPSSVIINRGSNATITLLPNTGYDFITSSLSCNNGAIGSLSGNTLTITNITNDNICSIKANISYICKEGTLVNDESKGFICTRNGILQTGSYSCEPCRQVPYTYVCGCQSCAQWCGQFTGDNKQSCLDACWIGAPGTPPNCFYGTVTCNGTTTECSKCPDTYVCPSGWSKYSGSGSSLICYKNATTN